jgi:hypothetical protein
MARNRTTTSWYKKFRFIKMSNRAQHSVHRTAGTRRVLFLAVYAINANGYFFNSLPAFETVAEGKYRRRDGGGGVKPAATDQAEARCSLLSLARPMPPRLISGPTLTFFNSLACVAISSLDWRRNTLRQSKDESEEIDATGRMLVASISSGASEIFWGSRKWAFYWSVQVRHWRLEKPVLRVRAEGPPTQLKGQQASRLFFGGRAMLWSAAIR